MEAHDEEFDHFYELVENHYFSLDEVQKICLIYIHTSVSDKGAEYKYQIRFELIDEKMSSQESFYRVTTYTTDYDSAKLQLKLFVNRVNNIKKKYKSA